MMMQHTLTQLHSLKLDGMARAFEEQAIQAAIGALSFEERFTLLVDRVARFAPPGAAPACGQVETRQRLFGGCGLSLGPRHRQALDRQPWHLRLTAPRP